MAKKKEHVSIGDIDIPTDYFKMSETDKRTICEFLTNKMYLLIDKNVDPKLNRLMVLEKIIESSIITNEMDESYEVCQVLVDMRKLLNEQTN